MKETWESQIQETRTYISQDQGGGTGTQAHQDPAAGVA